MKYYNICVKYIDNMYIFLSTDSASWLKGLRVKCTGFQLSESYEWTRARQRADRFEGDNLGAFEVAQSMRV